MAKDVDLSSKEWTDLIFEGKNKEFGAYTLRQASDRRHNLAVLYVIAGLVLVLIFAWLYGMYRAEKERAEKERVAELLANIEQEQFDELEVELDIPEDENQMEQEEEIPEPEEEEALAEEILNTEKFTEFLVQKDEDVKEEVKSADDVKDTSTALGSTDFDQGTDDLNIVREHKNEVIVEEKKPEPVEEKVFTSVEQMPQFPGGEGALLKYISDHIKYPTIAMENNVQGKVVVQFVVTRDGSIGEVKVARGKDPDLDKEAVRVVKTLPKFIPGKMNGQAVNVWYTLPINFKLQGV
ncbi:MAG: energy transducer TonB [Muribaculaceae bacterium]|nr:energy transducer TonB [Muribaculaceae bacterium]